MTFKRAISACIPSYFVDRVRAKRFARELADQERRDREEVERERANREASSWQDAVDRAGHYDDVMLTDFRLARSKAFNPNGSLLKANVLGLVADLTSRKELAITDFGGSTGELGRDYLQRYPSATYTVVDVPRLVGRCESRPGLVFTSEMPETCDIFYSSGTMQYLPDPMEVLKRGMNSSALFVILRRNHLSDRVVFDIQRPMLWENGDGPIPEGFPNVPISYPRQTLVESEIIRLADKLGFSCILKTDELVFRR